MDKLCRHNARSENFPVKWRKRSKLSFYCTKKFASEFYFYFRGIKKGLPFCPGTEKWDRTPGTEMPFCPGTKCLGLGQKGGTERLGQKGRDRTSRYHFFPLNSMEFLCNLNDKAVALPSKVSHKVRYPKNSNYWSGLCRKEHVWCYPMPILIEKSSEWEIKVSPSQRSFFHSFTAQNSGVRKCKYYHVK